MVVVPLASAAINTIAALAVRERDADLNTRAAELHVASDAGVSVGVAASGAIIVVTGGAYWPRPGGIPRDRADHRRPGRPLLKQSSRVLLEQARAGIDMDQLSRQVTEVPGVTTGRQRTGTDTATPAPRWRDFEPGLLRLGGTRRSASPARRSGAGRPRPQRA